MSNLLNIIIIVLALILAAVIVYGVFYYLNKKEENKNYPLTFNWASHLDGSGRFIGREINSETGASGRVVMTIRPLDIDWEKVQKEKLEIKDIKIIAEANKILVLSRGTNSPSKDCDLKFILPPSAEDLPEGIKDTILGKLMAQIIEDKDAIKSIEQCIREGSNRKSQYMAKLGDGEVSTELIDVCENVIKEIQTIVKDKAKTPTTFEQRT